MGVLTIVIKRMNKIVQMTSELNQILHPNIYRFEIDIEDIASGIKKTSQIHSESLSKSIEIEEKLTNCCGKSFSYTTRIVAVRFYKNGKLKKELKA